MTYRNKVNLQFVCVDDTERMKVVMHDIFCSVRKIQFYLDATNESSDMWLVDTKFCNEFFIFQMKTFKWKITHYLLKVILIEIRAL